MSVHCLTVQFLLDQVHPASHLVLHVLNVSEQVHLPLQAVAGLISRYRATLSDTAGKAYGTGVLQQRGKNIIHWCQTTDTGTLGNDTVIQVFLLYQG